MFSSFMINTWVVATLVAVVAGTIGFFVVLRGSAFAAHALPLGAFPGAAAADLFGINELIGLLVFSGLGAIGISQLSRKGPHDVATALCLVMFLGLGTLFLSMSTEYSQGVYALLFGEVLGISRSEIAPVAAMSVVAIAAVAVLFRPLLLSSISPELAEARGVPSRRVERWFLIILAFATSISVPVVGTLLVFSLMIGPAAGARALTDRPEVALVLSVGIALITVWSSIALAYTLNWPVGFFVGSMGALFYGMGRAFR